MKNNITIIKIYKYITFNLIRDFIESEETNLNNNKKIQKNISI